MDSQLPLASAAMRVCALVPYPLNTVPGQRYRIEQWQPYLEADGIAVEFVPFGDPDLMSLLYQTGRLGAKAVRLTAACASRLMQMTRLRDYDAILIYRTACLVGPAVIERVLARLGRPILFDFDDAIHLLHTTATNRRFGWLKFPGKTAALCRLSTQITVGNAYLADYARLHNPHVTIIPSSVDTVLYQPVQTYTVSEPVVVGWMGSSTSQTHLEWFSPVLRELAAGRSIELRVISDRRPNLDGVPFTWRPWSAETEVDELSQFDIGIMPMPDDPWALGKCSMKALQYMGVGLPSICSAVGMNREVIEHGENGFLATTPSEWLTHLYALIDDVALRERLGRRGRRTVEEQYSMRHCAGLFAQVVREAVGTREAGTRALTSPRTFLSEEIQKN